MRVGILGGGQLGWMTVLEGRRLGLEFYVLDKDPKAPACRVADRFFPPEDVQEFAKLCDVITYEFEHLGEELLKSVEGKLKPSLDVLELKKSRVREKLFYSRHAYPTARFTYAKAKDLREAVKSFGMPCLLKTERLGYDGKGQYRVMSLQDVEDALKNHGEDELFLIEEYVEFDFEYSVIGVRDAKGNMRTFPPTLNYHREGILLYNMTALEDLEEGRRMVESLMEELNIVGLLAVEFFYVRGKSLINEMAPRPHNTGHYTLDACYTSQFENLLRAVCGLPLGSTRLKAYGGMLNLLGVSLEELDLDSLLSLEGTKLYWYGKEKRPRRKMGHINVVSHDYQELRTTLLMLKDAVYPNLSASGLK